MSIMESPSVGDTYWTNPHCVYSPTGSVDSGVGLTPEDIGNCDDFPSLFPTDLSPESRTGGKIPTQLDGYSGYDSNEIFPTNQLTPDELDALSESSGLSPASTDYRFNAIQDHEELAPSAYPQRSQPCVESSDNMQKRRRRQQERDSDLHKSHPHVPSCLVPKSGTSKPRQSRKRRKSQSTNSMTLGQGKSMSERNCYVGARVKKTAKERLEELRRGRDNKRQSTSQQAEVPEQPIEPSQRLSPDIVGPSPKRRCPIIDDDRVIIPNRAYATHVMSQPQQPQSYNHSVQQILQPIPQRYTHTPDELEMCMEEFLRRYNDSPLNEYAQRHARACFAEGRENSPLRYLLHKLHEKKESYCPEDMCKIAEFLCQYFGKFINAENFDGETPIYEAALHGNEGVTIALMNLGANPWIAENKGGQSALHAAIRSKKLGVVVAILEYPKEVAKRWPSGINCPANDGNTPLHVATALTGVNAGVKKEIILKLLDYGADTTKKNHMSQMPHSFLVNDPNFKELHSGMKRSSQRKKSVPTPVLSMGPTHQQPRYHGMYPASYPTQDQFMQSIHPNPNFQQQYGCASLQYTGSRFPTMPAQNDVIPRFESRNGTTSSPVYYDNHNAHIPAFTTAGNDLDEFLSSFQ